MPEVLSPGSEETRNFIAPRTGDRPAEASLFAEEELDNPLGIETPHEAPEIPYYLTTETKTTLDNLLAMSTNDLKEQGLDKVIDLIFQLQEHAKQNYEDELTQAPNRRAFGKQIEREKNRERIPGKDTYAYMVDINDFKQYNTFLSHVGGDRALQHLADQMRAEFDKQIRPHDFFGRYGGDEFVMVARDMKNEEDAVSLGNRLTDRLAENWITMPISWVEEEKHDAMRSYVHEATLKERGFIEKKLAEAENANTTQEKIVPLKERLAHIDSRLSKISSTEILEVPLRVSMGVAKVEDDNDLLKAFKRGNLANNDVAKAKKEAGEEYTISTYNEWLERQEERQAPVEAPEPPGSQIDLSDNMGG